MHPGSIQGGFLALPEIIVPQVGARLKGIEHITVSVSKIIIWVM
tara:strand:- start:257 stop:388 length:132 start_codon:yes stop_codon:yes gene_type:complete